MERIWVERAGAAPAPDQEGGPGGESARPGEVQRLLDVIARVRGELAVAETKIAAQERVLPGEGGAKSVVRADPAIAGTERGVLVADFPGPGGRIGAQYCWIYPTGLHTFAVRGR